MTAPAARSPRKAKGQGPERREEILAAALKLFMEFGVSAVSTRQIAQAVGISQPTLYAYFPTKDDIGKELHGRTFALLAERLKERDRGRMEGADAIVEMLRVYVDFGLENPDMYRIAFMGESDRNWWTPQDIALSPATASTYGVLRSKITDLHARGLTIDLDAETLTQSVWFGMHGLVSLMIAKPGFPWVEREHLIDSHLRIVVRGVLKAR